MLLFILVAAKSKLLHFRTGQKHFAKKKKVGENRRTGNEPSVYAVLYIFNALLYIACTKRLKLK